MPKKYVLFVLLVISMATATVASAQEKGQVGLNLGYPLIGVTWHLTDKVAVRPEFNFSFGSGSTTSISGGDGVDSDAWSMGFGVSALFYVWQWDDVKGYVAPRLSFVSSETERSASIDDFTSESSTSGWDAGLSVGAQYPFNRRLSVFGEVGFAYIDRHAELEGPIGLASEGDSWSLGPRTAIGLILYF